MQGGCLIAFHDARTRRRTLVYIERGESPCASIALTRAYEADMNGAQEQVLQPAT